MKNVSYKVLVVTLASFVLGACGGDSDGDDEKDVAEMTYEEVVASYENSNFPVSGEGSLDGVWVRINADEASIIEDFGTGDTIDGESIHHIESDGKRIEIEIWSIKENLADGTLVLNKCSTEPDNNFITPFDVILDDDGNREFLNYFGEEFASIDSATKISILEEEYSNNGGESTSISSFTGRSIGALIKISDTYKESIGTITVDGESRDTSCFVIEYVTWTEEELEEGEVSKSTTESVGVMFNEEGFIDSDIYDTVGGSGDYDDYFEAELYVYNPEEFIDSEGSDGEAGYLELSEEGPLTFSGESEVILQFGGAINISFDFNLL